MTGKFSSDTADAGASQKGPKRTAVGATPEQVRESDGLRADVELENPNSEIPVQALSSRLPEDSLPEERAPQGVLTAGTDPYIGTTVDQRYFIEAILGEGGMGVVYRCRHTIIGKLVAMKVLRPELARNEEVTERFLNEARSASSIGNAHIIDISDFGRLSDGATYFVMEYLDGTSLAEIASLRDTIALDRVANIMLQLADGLDAAHAKGIIHRDLKPDNIFLIEQGDEADFVKILDFGIAKATSSTSKLTQAGQIFGTPHYMSPEQASGQPVDKRADIYAFGVILYELSTCRLPFDADHFMGVLNQHVYAEPVAPSSFADLPDPVSPELESVILTCLAKSPDDRYPSMRAVRADLLRLFPALQVHPTSPPASVQLLAHPSSFARSSAFPGPPSLDSSPTVSKANHRLKLVAFALTALLLGALSLFALRNFSNKSSSPVTPIATRLKETIATTPRAQEQSDVAISAISPIKSVQVLLRVTPKEAQIIFSDGQVRGDNTLIEVPPQGLEAHVQSAGYRSIDLRLDGKKKEITIGLLQEKGSTAPANQKLSPGTRKKGTSKKTPLTQPVRLEKPIFTQPQAEKKRSPAPAPRTSQPDIIGQDELVDPWE